MKGSSVLLKISPQKTYSIHKPCVSSILFGPSCGNKAVSLPYIVMYLLIKDGRHSDHVVPDLYGLRQFQVLRQF